MRGVDWRELYAQNRAVIARAGISSPAIGELPTGLTFPSDLPFALEAFAPEAFAPEALRRRADAPADGGAALVHVPRGLDPAVPAPLVCMLHGCTQDPETFAAATAMNAAADRHGFVAVYPRQHRGRNPRRCWNWFLPEHQQRGRGEPAAIARVLRDVIERDTRCSIDPGRVFVAGLSSGAAMAHIMATCYPDLVAAVAVHSGLAYASARNLPSALNAMARANANADVHGHAAKAAMGQYARPVPTLVIHGTDDRVVVPANAIQVLRQSMAVNHLVAPETCNHDIAHPTTTSRRRAAGGRDYTQSRWHDGRGALVHELIEVDGLGHAWSGGTPGGSYTDSRGPSATEAIWTFFSLITPPDILALINR